MTAQKQTLAELTARWKRETEKQETDSNNTNALWKRKFDFWKADFDTTTVFRFLPDKNTDNLDQFFVRSYYHELWVGGKKKVFACNKHMNGGKGHCPLCELSAKYYDQKNPEHNPVLGKKYYRKLDYVSQGLILETPLEHDANLLVKYITYSQAMHARILANLGTGDLDDMPWNMKDGYNYRITKTVKKTDKGDVGDYSTSSFRPKMHSLDDELIEQVTAELRDLRDYLPQTLSNEEIEGLLLASMNNDSMPSPKAPAEHTGDESHEPVPQAPAQPASSSADRFANLRNRLNGARAAE